MYSMVMMMAMAGSGDVAGFGGHKGGSCCGTPTCAPVVVASGCCGGHHHGGLLAGWKAKHSCHGTAAPVCCAPAPVYVAPAPVYVAPVAACAPACAAPTPSCGCHGGHVGLLAKWKAKHSCCGSTISYVAPTCSLGTTTVTSPATPAKPMTPPTPGTEMKKKDS